jgi:hypothetical protein
MKMSTKELVQRLLLSFVIVVPNIVLSYLTKINNSLILNLYEKGLMIYVNVGIVVWVLTWLFIGWKIGKRYR